MYRISIVLLVVVFLGSVFAEGDVDIADLDLLIFNLTTAQPEESVMTISYNEEEAVFYLNVNEGYETVAMMLSKEELAVLIGLMRKFIEWNDLAIEKQVTLDKEIGTFRDHLFWTYGGDWHAGWSDFSCKFVSGSVNIHFMSIFSSKAVSLQNEYVTKMMKPWMFTKAVAERFIEAVSPGNVEATLAKARKQSEIEAMFR